MLARSALGVVVVGLTLASVALTQAPAPPANPAAQDKQVVSSKAVHRTAGASVNFRKQLGLPFPSLATIGPRIDAARRAPDPVALAHAASELSVAEKVSGKKATLTSTAVLQESAELAKLRKQAKELLAVQKVAEQVSAEEELVTNIRASIADAQAITQLDVRAANQNLEPTWQPRSVVVNNYTPQYVVVYVNGNYKGEIGPGLQQTYIIEHRWNPTVLTATGNEDIDQWGPRYIWGRFKTYTWNIN